uniref:Small ribosomal subunit protein uS15c n=1 Tax=Helianthus annuus TaxID=4232 RepID=A0A1Y3BXI5_HELAN
MVKNSFISIILKEQEENKENRGSVEFQVVSFTNKIRRLTSHLELHKKDYLSQRGLRKILGKRQRLLAYLSKKNRVRYKELIGQLDIRERKTPIHARMNREKPMTVPSTRKDLMIVNMGPHHPSMHGVLRLIVTLDGEDVIDCEPILGYLHRGMEKIAENRTIIQYLPYVTRWDYLATMFTEAITVNAPEQLGNIQVPKRASYIRVIMLELSRIASHLLWLGPFMADIGAQTPFFYIFRERELIYDLFEAATGMRMMHNFFRIGGVAADLPHGWIDKCLDFCDYFLTGIAEYQKLITRNPIFLERVEGVGIIGGEEAINWGLSGPMLRASGIEWDLRKVDHYECYDEFDWEVQWQKEGDSLARYLVRISEMTESIKIIQQALEGIPGGPYENLEIRRFDRVKDTVWNEFDYRFISKNLLRLLNCRSKNFMRESKHQRENWEFF